MLDQLIYFGIKTYVFRLVSLQYHLGSSGSWFLSVFVCYFFTRVIPMFSESFILDLSKLYHFHGRDLRTDVRKVGDAELPESKKS